jgi:hypothetical protein
MLAIVLVLLHLISSSNAHSHSDHQPTSGGTVQAEVHGYFTLSSDLELHYTLDNVRKTVMFELTVNKAAWIGFGVAGSSGGMTGADVVVGSGSGIVQRKFLGGKTLASIQDMPNDEISNVSYSMANGQYKLFFMRSLATNATNGLAINAMESMNFIWAVGSSTGFDIHASEDSVSLNLNAAALASGEDSLVLGHGALMFLSWGFTFMIGSIIPRYFRNVKSSFFARDSNSPALWFRLHQAFQTIGFILQIIAFALIVSFVNKSGDEHFDGSHGTLGLIIFIASFIQPIGAACRPKAPGDGEQKTESRKFWELLHHWIGRLLIILGIINIFLGIKQLTYASDKNTFYGFLVALWILIALVVFYKEYRRRGKNNS